MTDLTDEALGRIGFEAFAAFWDFDPSNPPAPPGQQTYRAWEVAAVAIAAHVRAEQQAAVAALVAEHTELERRIAYLEPLVTNPETRSGARALAWVYLTEIRAAGQMALAAAPPTGGTP